MHSPNFDEFARVNDTAHLEANNFPEFLGAWQLVQNYLENVAAHPCANWRKVVLRLLRLVHSQNFDEFV